MTWFHAPVLAVLKGLVATSAAPGFKELLPATEGETLAWQVADLGACVATWEVFPANSPA